jgi:PBP1b-binding outer membrane lipoprotein LpoB
MIMKRSLITSFTILGFAMVLGACAQTTDPVSPTPDATTSPVPDATTSPTADPTVSPTTDPTVTPSP